MPQVEFTSRRKGRLSLAVRISAILMLAAVLPLLITVGVSAWFLGRPALIDQADQTMTTDAKTRVQLIDTYFTERLLDAETLSQVPAVPTFLELQPVQPVSPTSLQYPAFLAFKDAATHAGFALAAGKIRDSHYVSWWLFYANGTPNLSYPVGIQPHRYGQDIVPPEELQAVQNDTTGQAIISPVYYDPNLKKAFVDIYAPIFADGTPKSAFVGFMRATLNLDYIWGIVKDDQGINNSGKSFILDLNGVRVADTDSQSKDLFTTSASISTPLQQQITEENWYSQNGDVPQHSNPTLANFLQSSTPTNPANSPAAQNFSLTLSGTDYQAAEKQSGVMPWTYFVISTSSSVTHVADQQLLYTIGTAALVALLAGGIGLLVSGRISRPIMRSVDQLRESSESLNILAKKQQSASSEQLWVVDSVQVGLQSVQYYTDATRIAAHKLGEIGMELERNWHRQNIETIKQGLQQVISAANYIEKATYYQGDSGQKLSTAIKVTTQVNEQLADGAISATEAASQLEQVVSDLRHVVGQ